MKPVFISIPDAEAYKLASILSGVGKGPLKITQGVGWIL